MSDVFLTVLYICFLQGVLLCPQTLAQSRKSKLRRAFTDATSDTITYVKTVVVPPIFQAPHL